MDPLDHKTVQKNHEKEVSKVSVSSTKIIPKHNNLLVFLLIILFMVVAALGTLFVYQLRSESDQRQEPKLEEPQVQNNNSSTPTDSLENPITTDIDNEVEVLDQSISSQNDGDFSSNSLSDTSLGL